MKKVSLLLIVFAMLFLATSCESSEDPVIASLGEYDNYEYYSEGGIDILSFGKCYFSSVNLEGNEYFSIVSEADIGTINAFIDNFESWIDTSKEDNSQSKLEKNYSFDRSIIDTEDYFYIYSYDPEHKFREYRAYFFDTQTNILYEYHVTV